MRKRMLLCLLLCGMLTACGCTASEPEETLQSAAELTVSESEPAGTETEPEITETAAVSTETAPAPAETVSYPTGELVTPETYCIIKEYEYASDGDGAEPHLAVTICMDAGEHELSRESYDRDGSVFERYEYQYVFLSDGRVAAEQETREKHIRGITMTETYLHQYEYSEDGTSVAVTSYTDGEWFAGMLTAYDEYGNEISKMLLYDDESAEYTPVASYTYTYDGNGNILTASEVRDSGFGSDSVYCYDDTGQLISITKTVADSDRTVSEYAVEIITYSYDAQGNRISTRTERKGQDNGSLSVRESAYEYDAQNRITAEKYFVDGRLTTENIWEYVQ